MADTIFEDPFSEEVWKSTYKDHNDKTVDDTMRRVARFVASAEDAPYEKDEWEDKFYDMLSGFKCTAGGRIYANAGTEFGGTTMMNCYVSPRRLYDIDSLDGIVEDVLNQCQTLKSEGGWGQNFSWIRPRGAFIHGIGVETPGAIKYMEIYDKTSDVITSGSGKKSANKKAKGKIRKGAMMSALDCWHPDVIEFITAKQQPGRLTKFNVSVNCTDEFMEAVKNDEQWDLCFPNTAFEAYKEEWDGNLKSWEEKGYPVKVYRTVEARWLWNLILESTYNRAEPGVLFLDRANRFGPLSYAETIVATNPCLVGDTLIPTQNGLICLDELVDQFEGGNPVECLSSDLKGTLCFRAISNVVRSGVKQTITLHLSNGMQITSTPDHKFWTGSEWCEARLCQGKMFDLVSQYRFSDNYDFNFEFCSTYTGKNNREYFTNLPTKWTEDLALVLGWLVGDGWITDTGAGFIFGKDDQEMCERFRRIFNKWGCSVSEVVDNHHSITLYLTSSVVKQLFENLGVLKVKSSEKRVPSSIFKSPKNIVSSFLRGLFSADGSVLEMKNSNFWVSLCSSSRLLLNDVQHLLLMYGITHHKTYDINKTSVFKYTTVRGEERQYIGNTYHDLRIYGHGIITFFEEIGFSLTRKHQMLSNIQGKRFKKKQPSVVVVDIEEAGPKDVYDITEPVFHNFVANGVVVHNCGEQTLAPGGVCNLGSINLTQFIVEDGSGFDLEEIKKYVRYLNRFLDNINSLSSAPLPEYMDSMRNKRRVGIGILGWGSALFVLKVRFGSRRANDLRDQVMSTIAREAYMSSIDLAEEKGMFKYCNPRKHMEGAFIQSLDLSKKYLEKLCRVGIRNSSLLSIQPTGNTSIFANVVSGGLEPIFMPEYVRTVIVNHMPDHIAEVTPKWYEGEWYETEMFKVTKEGDEEILKGTDPSSVVYKIDKNRGLTKEVICEDYGVRWLKAHNQWNPKAKWAATTTTLSVKDHVSDLKGFARWVDSACSKTINVPYDYPFDDFKDIYLDAYDSGYVKGVTTYRAGTMTTVLSAKEDKMADVSDEEIIMEDVKVPTQAPAVVNTIRGDGKKWYLTTIMNEQQTRPIAFFVHTNHHEKTVQTQDAIDRLIQLAKDKHIPARWIYETVLKMEKDTNATKIARAISLNLRHGVLIKNVVSVLDRVEDVFVGSFLFQIKKYLSTFIKEGEKVEGEKCLECGSETIIFSEGCKKCLSCGSSKCG